jgi:single-stranded DNA-binding protein
MNEVKLSGKIYNKKEAHTPSGKLCTTFGLSVWNGKKDGNNTYEFMNCKLWGELTDTDGEKIVQGKLAFDTWEKDGKKQVRPYILVDSVRKGEFVKKEAQQAQDSLDDGIPF